jgi:NAD-dependent SIR2 family protein deacetylase
MKTPAEIINALESLKRAELANSKDKLLTSNARDEAKSRAGYLEDVIRDLSSEYGLAVCSQCEEAKEIDDCADQLCHECERTYWSNEGTREEAFLSYLER